MRNFAYFGGLSHICLLRHIKNDFFSLFQNEVKSVLNIKESYSMEKSRKNVSKNSHRNFIKRGGGAGGQRPFINFIKKQEIWYWMASLTPPAGLSDEAKCQVRRLTRKSKRWGWSWTRWWTSRLRRRSTRWLMRMRPLQSTRS